MVCGTRDPDGAGAGRKACVFHGNIGDISSSSGGERIYVAGKGVDVLVVLDMVYDDPRGVEYGGCTASPLQPITRCLQYAQPPLKNATETTCKPSIALTTQQQALATRNGYVHLLFLSVSAYWSQREEHWRKETLPARG